MSSRDETIRALVEAAGDRGRPPLVMGVLNVTPDSFYDGGRYADPSMAIERGRELIALGADIIDVGGESTRPGAVPVSDAEEMGRVLPVVKALAGGRAAVSIDTRRAAVAKAALDAGAVVVNDVSGFARDPGMLALLGAERPVAIAMHMRGTPADMPARASYRSVVADVAAELWSGATRACEAGLPLDRLWLDPGIGFAKTWDQSLALLGNLDVFARLGRPIVVGVSRKSFIGHVLDRPEPEGRLFGTAAAVALAVARGARVLRVHDVAEMRDVVRVAHAVATAGRWEVAA